MTRISRALATTVAGGALVAAVAAPAAASPLVTGGLVNVTVTDLLNNNTVLSNDNVSVGAALNVAANVCDVSVNVLAEQLGSGNTATCSNATRAVAIAPAG